MLTDFRVRQRDYLLEISRALTEELDLAHGCILSSGAEPFPAESGWAPFLDSDRLEAVFLDVGELTYMLRGREDGNGYGFFEDQLDRIWFAPAE